MKTLEELGISPAPWKLIPYGLSTESTEATHGDIVDAIDQPILSCFPIIEDAHIMKASPKMYEALYLILRCWGHGILAEGGFACEYECTDEDARCTWEDCPILKKARAALAEASGEVANV